MVVLAIPPTRTKRMLSRHPRYDLISQQGGYRVSMMGTACVILTSQKKRMPWGITGSLINCSLIENRCLENFGENFENRGVRGWQVVETNFLYSSVYHSGKLFNLTIGNQYLMSRQVNDYYHLICCMKFIKQFRKEWLLSSVEILN